MLLKIMLVVIMGGLLGSVVGWGLKCSGGACPLTCNPWGGAIIGALIGLLIVLSK